MAPCDRDNPLHILTLSVATNYKNPLLQCWMRFMSDMTEANAGCAYQLHVKTYRTNATGPLVKVSILRQKIKFVRKTLTEIPAGSRFLFTDLDVLPLRSLSALLHTKDVTGTPAHMRDIVFMKETPGSGAGFFNTGVYLGRATNATHKFFTSWQNALAVANMMDNDQTVANRLLQRSGVGPSSSNQMTVDSIRSDLSWSVFPQHVVVGRRHHIVWGATVMFHAIFIPFNKEKAAMLHQVWSDQGGRAKSPRVVDWCDAPQSTRSSVAPGASPCPAPFTELAFRSIVGALLASDSLPPGSIIDAGANDGSDACFYAEASPSRIVHAIEPLMQNVRVIERWAVGRPNLRAMRAGLGNKSSLVHPEPHLLRRAPGLLAQMSNFQGRRLLETKWQLTRAGDAKELAGPKKALRAPPSQSQPEASEASFTVHRLDNLFLGTNAPWMHERLGFAHFDLEGGELDVIRSARLIIQRDRPVFTIEINVHRERARTRALLTHVGELGYATYAVLENCGSPWADCRNVLAFPLDWLRKHAAGQRYADFTVRLGAAGSVLDLAWHSSKLVRVTAENVEKRAGYRACIPGNECCNGVLASHPHLGTCPCLIECVQQWWRSQPSHATAGVAQPVWNQRAAGQRLFFEQNFSAARLSAPVSPTVSTTVVE